VQFLPLFVIIPVLSVLFVLMWTFDRLVGIEFEQFPEDWRADGKPHTLLWHKYDMPRTFRSSFATQRCTIVWLFVMPKWADGHAEASRYVRRLRVFFILWLFVALPLLMLSGIVSAAFTS